MQQIYTIESILKGDIVSQNHFLGLKAYQGIKLHLETFGINISGKQIKMEFCSSFKIKKNNNLLTDDNYRFADGDNIGYTYNGKDYSIKIKNDLIPNITNLNSVEDKIECLLLWSINLERDIENKLDSLHSQFLSKKEISLICAVFIEHLKEFSSNYIHKVYDFFDKHCQDIYRLLNISTNDQTYVKGDKLFEGYSHVIDNFKNFSVIKPNKNNLNTITQEIRKTLNSKIFNTFLKPYFNEEFVSSKTLDTVINPIKEVYSNPTTKLDTFRTNKHNYDTLIRKISESNEEYSIKYLIPVFRNLFDLFKYEVYGNQAGLANFKIQMYDKKYPFHQKDFSLLINLINEGNGYAANLRLELTSNDLRISNRIQNFNDVKIGLNVLPFVVTDILSNQDKLKVNYILTWENIDSTKKELNGTLFALKQDSNIPWDSILSLNPYSLQFIKDKNKLFGRDNVINQLINNFSSESSQSFIIYGQKRVGKTSIVKSLENYFDTNEVDTFISYVDGSITRKPNPEDTIKTLGENLSKNLKKKIIKRIDKNIEISNIIDKLKIPTFSDSIVPLADFVDDLENIFKSSKFLFIIDEFDSLSFSLYKPSNLSNTFFENLRGLNNKDTQNLKFIFVGSENMPLIYNWHGMKLNNWKNIQVDIFPENEKFNTYRNLIQKPVEPYINFNNQSISLIYEYSGGNPYFTNMICDWILKEAYERKDSYITELDVQSSIDKNLEYEAKTSFQHYWVDGVLDIPENIDIMADFRKRFLIAFSIALNVCKDITQSKGITIEEIKKYYIPNPEIKEKNNSLMSQIDDFKKRQILIETDIGLRVKPTLFELWLKKFGKKELITGITDIEHFIEQQTEDEKFRVTKDSIKPLREKLLDKIKIDDTKILNWLSQFGNHKTQSEIFNIFCRLKYVSDNELEEMCNMLLKQSFEGTNIKLQEKLKYQKKEIINNVLFTFIDRVDSDKSRFHAFLMNSIDAKNTFVNFDELDESKIRQNDLVIIFEPIISEETFLPLLRESLSTYFTKYKDIETQIVFLSLFAKDNIFKEINSYLKSLKYPIRYLNSNIIDLQYYPFRITNRDTIIHESQLMIDINKTMNENVNLQYYINLCLECVIPSVSIPFYWYKSENFKPLFDLEHSDYTLNIKNNNREQSYILGKEIEEELSKVMLHELRNEFGNNIDDWWVKGIPENVRKVCAERYEIEKRQFEIYSYIDLIDYSIIAKYNPILRKYIYLDEENYKWNPENISKEKATSWLTKLNEIRKKYAHPTKPAPTNDDLSYLKSLHKSFFDNIKKSQK